MEDKKVIRCFIASPGDTAEEREICEKVFSDINAGIGTTYGFILQSLRWENDVHPGLGNGGQEVINSQIKDKYDLFIGIMYTKFGTPTEHAESGTEEEFHIAYERALQQKNMEIMFYFNDAALNPSKINIEQYQKVTNFRTDVVQKKCMYSMYDGIQDFEQKLRKHLNLYFHEHYLSADKNTAEKLTRTSFILEERLNSALQLFSGQPRIWIDPIISSKQDISIHPDENYEDRIDVNTIIDNPTSIIISAPPQFGLTCLSHYMINEAWRKKKLWIYVDAKKIKAHNVSTYINNEFVQLGIDIQTNIECIILDEWCPSENGALKKLKAICDAYSDIPIILMRTLEESKFLKERQEEIKINREFTPLFLLPMTRNQVRTFVQEYNQKTHIADEGTEKVAAS